MKLFGDLSPPTGLTLPHHQKDEVLRIGETDLGKKWSIGPGHRVRGRIQGETELIPQATSLDM